MNINELINSVSTMDLQTLLNVALVPVLAIVLAFLIGTQLNIFIANWLNNRLDIDEESWRFRFLRALRGVPRLLCMYLAVYMVVNTVSIGHTIQAVLSSVLTAMAIFTGTQVVARTITSMLDHFVAKNPNMPSTSLLDNIVNVAIYFMGILCILSSWGVAITPILTAMGVGGMAVALGLQDTLANIFAGLWLILSGQLKTNDYIKLASGEEGKVVDITWRFTTIVAIAGNAIVIPNKNISASTITNYSMPEPDMSVYIKTGVAYGSDLDQVEQVALDVARAVTAEVDPDVTKEPSFYFRSFGESSIDFWVILHCSKFMKQYQLQHEYIKALSRTFREYGIDIPFPIRTVYQPDLPKAK